MRKQAFAAALLVALIAVPASAQAQNPPPPAESFEKLVLDDTPGEPMNLAVLPDGRVLHTTRAGEVRHVQRAHRAQHARGRVRRVLARRGGSPERRDRPELREQPVGVRVLLAAGHHAGRRSEHAGDQRGRRAARGHAGGLGEVQGRDPAEPLQAGRRQARHEHRGEDPRGAGRPRDLLPRRRQHRLRRRGQPAAVHGRRHEPVRVRRLHADRRLGRTATRRSTRAAARATRTTCAARSCASARRTAAATRSRRATCSARARPRPSPRST